MVHLHVNIKKNDVAAIQLLPNPKETVLFATDGRIDETAQAFSSHGELMPFEGDYRWQDVSREVSHNRTAQQHSQVVHLSRVPTPHPHKFPYLNTSTSAQ